MFWFPTNAVFHPERFRKGEFRAVVRIVEGLSLNLEQMFQFDRFSWLIYHQTSDLKFQMKKPFELEIFPRLRDCWNWCWCADNPSHQWRRESDGDQTFTLPPRSLVHSAAESKRPSFCIAFLRFWLFLTFVNFFELSTCRANNRRSINNFTLIDAKENDQTILLVVVR